MAATESSHAIRKNGSLCGGHYVSEFLKSCTCGADKCNNLLTFEKTEEVVCNGVTSIKQGGILKSLTFLMLHTN